MAVRGFVSGDYMLVSESEWRAAIAANVYRAATVIERELPDGFSVDPEFPFVAAVHVITDEDAALLVVRFDPADGTYSVALPSGDGADGFPLSELGDALAEWAEIGLAR